MKDYNNPNPPSLKGEANQWNPKETVEALQNFSKNIREYSMKMKDTMKALRESGAIPELAEAIREGSFAVRDTVRDINETTKEIQRKGIIVDTARSIENTYQSAKESIETVKQISFDSKMASPNAIKAVHDGFDLVKKETNVVSGIVVNRIKHRVVA